MNPTQDSGDNFTWTADLVKEFCEYAGLRIGKSADIREQLNYLMEDFKKAHPSSREGKDWEIVSFKGILPTNDGLFSLGDGGMYYWGRWGIGPSGLRLESMLKNVNKYHTIHSVRRISDNTTWTVGDVLNKWGKIDGFKIQSGKWILAVCKQNSVFMEDWEKEPVKEVLFTKFNLNDEVLVQITDYGWGALAKKNTERFIENCIRSRKEMVNGEEYYRFQASFVIETFGEMVFCANVHPINSNILVPIKPSI